VTPTPRLRRAGPKAILANVTSTTAAAAQEQQTSPVMTVIDG
jgi:hypothetical protein